MKLKRLIPCLGLATWAAFALGGESSLTTTYQPLSGLGSGTIVIVPVACHDWYSHSGQPTQIGLISAANVPPTNNPQQAKQDLNLASLCGLRFTFQPVGETTAPPEVVLDASQFSLKSASDFPREDIIRASLECLRRCLPEPHRNAKLILQSSAEDKAWLQPIVAQFNAHDRTKTFYPSGPQSSD